MQTTLDRQGYYLAPSIFSPPEVAVLQQLVTEDGGASGFGVRYYLEHKPAVLQALLACQDFLYLLQRTFSEPIIIKSTYFDKPPRANWTVPWHQDITVNLAERVGRPGYSNWRELNDRIAVQPPTAVLEQITAYRIHLDDTDAENGALRVVAGSHRRGIVRVDGQYQHREADTQTICVGAGGVHVMKPLLLHSSRRARSTPGAPQCRRRVIHLEVIEHETASDLPWRERYDVLHLRPRPKPDNR